jgi:hypothetical protein
MRLIDADALPISFDGHTVSVWKKDLDEAPTINPYEWISINDKLPKQFQEVLTCRGGFIGNLINVYTYMGNNEWEDSYGYWNSAEGEGITHWMPLPKLPNIKENCDEE